MGRSTSRVYFTGTRIGAVTKMRVLMVISMIILSLTAYVVSAPSEPWLTSTPCVETATIICFKGKPYDRHANEQGMADGGSIFDRDRIRNRNKVRSTTRKPQ